MPTNPTAILDFDLVDKALNELGYSFDDDEVIVKYVRFFPYYFVPTIVYINVQGKEFFIPYATNPYMTDFKNGEIYEIKELIPHIAESEKGVFEPPEVPKEEKIIVWSIVGAVLIAIIAICALILKSDRKTQKA